MGVKGGVSELQEAFGQIDIYVFDQILRGNIAPGMRVLDAGCGHGRNLLYLLRAGYEVFALDGNVEGVEQVQWMARQLQPDLPAHNFRVGLIEDMPFADGTAEVVLCNSVLHFAQDQRHFEAMLGELWRVVRPGGMLFCRLGSRIGMDFERVEGNRYTVSGGYEWYLVDEPMLMGYTERLGGTLVDPLKTTVVQGSRCMTTWVVRKPV